MKVCRTCGHNNQDDAEFCTTCGSALDTQAASREERKTVTILFCDMVEFTSRFDQADPEDVRETLATYHRCVRREIERFGGTVEKFIGDAVMAVFGAPLAHEDDALRAVLAALRIPPAIEELNESNRDLPIAVRIGVETGVAVVSIGPQRSEQGIAIGDVVSTASRLQGVAPIGGVLVGEWAHRLTEELFDYEALDPVQVKGKAEPQRVWVARAARSRFGAELQRGLPTPFVGRQDELELLKHTFARSVREPSVQLVTLLGEPGVGKSRLIRELFAYTDDQPELLVAWRLGRCLPYGEGVTFWALGEIVKAHAGILESDDARTARTKLAATIAALVDEPAEGEWIGSRIAPLIGLADSKAEGVEQLESFSAWRLFLEAIASQGPLVIALEDLHWAQAAMIDFLTHLLEWSSGYPMLILCSARPELLQRHPQWGGGMRNSIAVSLAPLSNGETRALLESMLPGDTAPDVYDLIAERAGGNPLFAEEFVRMLQDRSGGASVGSDVALLSESSPESLDALIAARLDTLDADEKSLLQDASVIGRVFWPTAVAAVSGSDVQRVQAGLRHLAQRELVRPSRISSVQEDAEYAFAHGLIRDVAYGQIPRLERVDKHVVAAGWIERLAVERVADHADMLAHHYGRALDLSRAAGLEGLDELEEATRRALMLAGERAMALDITRATESFDGVLELLPPGHPDRADALYWKADAAKDSGQYEEAEELYREAIAAYREGGNRIGEGVSLTKLATDLWERGAYAESRKLLARSATILESEPPGPELATCYVSTASARILVGAFDDAIELSERGLDLGRRFEADALVSRALSYRGTARCFSGDPDGLGDLSDALEVAESIGDSKDAALARLVRAEVEWASQGPTVALDTIRTGRDLAERRGVLDMVFFFDALSLGPLFDLGAWDELLVVADDIVQGSRQVGGQYAPALAHPWITQVLLWRDRHAEASDTAASLRAEAMELRDAQVLVPASVATALVAIHQGRTRDALEIVQELDRESVVSLSWYRENFLADLVRVCAACDDLALAHRLVERSRPTATRHELSLLSATAAIEEGSGNVAEAADVYERAAEGWREYGHQVETGLALLGAARCLDAMGDARSAERRARAGEIFDGLGAAPFVPLREGPAD